MNSWALAFFGRLDALLIGGPFTGVFEVVHHRVGEQEGFLQHGTDLLAQALPGQLAQVLTIDEDGAAVDIVVAGQDVDDRALARSRGSTDADRSHPGATSKLLLRRIFCPGT